MIHSTARMLALAVLALPTLISAPSGAETRVIPDSVARPAAEIAAERIAPAQLRVASGAPFALRNGTDALARVEFKVRSGQGLHCAADASAPAKGRRFLVNGGGTLVCSGDPGTYTYTVYRTLGGKHRRSQGRVEIEAAGEIH